jgi:hypothetical protein
MTRIQSVVLACAMMLAACSSGAISTAPPPRGVGGLVSTSFTFVLAKTAAAAKRRPQYLTTRVQSVRIALNTVNGGAPPAGLTTNVTTNITLSACPCTIPGPSVPPGTDTFTLTTYDAQSGSGNVISTASPSYTITAGTVNDNTVTLNGVPATLAISGVATATAGTAFASPQSFTVNAKDADGNTILGTYAVPITLTDDDASGATAINTAGADSPPSGELIGSSDTATLGYNGRAISPVTISASASGASSASATFAPALQAIAYSGPVSSGNPEIDLFATSGNGSSDTFTASELGLTNTPFNGTLNVSLAGGCGNIATVSPASGTAFTISAVAIPSAGSCTLTIGDGFGQTKAVTLTYTTSSFGVQ